MPAGPVPPRPCRPADAACAAAGVARPEPVPGRIAGLSGRAGAAAAIGRGPIKAPAQVGRGFVAAVTSPRVVASYRVTFGASLIAALVNLVFGPWSHGYWCAIVFPARRLLDALVDLPFALPTAVAGIALAALLGRSGWLGRACWRRCGLKMAYTPAGHRHRAHLHRRAVRRAHGAAGAGRRRGARSKRPPSSLGADALADLPARVAADHRCRRC